MKRWSLSVHECVNEILPALVGWSLFTPRGADRHCSGLSPASYWLFWRFMEIRKRSEEELISQAQLPLEEEEVA